LSAQSSSTVKLCDTQHREKLRSGAAVTQKYEYKLYLFIFCAIYQSAMKRGEAAQFLSIHTHTYTLTPHHYIITFYSAAVKSKEFSTRYLHVVCAAIFWHSNIRRPFFVRENLQLLIILPFEPKGWAVHQN